MDLENFEFGKKLWNQNLKKEAKILKLCKKKKKTWNCATQKKNPPPPPLPPKKKRKLVKLEIF